jgi:hypothetical protein
VPRGSVFQLVVPPGRSLQAEHLVADGQRALQNSIQMVRSQRSIQRKKRADDISKPGQMTAAEYEADFKGHMEEFRARSSKPKPKTEFTVEDDDLIWAYQRAHPKHKAKLDTLDHDKVLKKARRWLADVIGAALRGHVDILLRKMGPK